MLLLWSCGAGHNHGENHGEHGAEAAAHDHLHHDAEEAAHHHDGEDPHDHDAMHGHEVAGHEEDAHGHAAGEAGEGHTDEIVIPAEKAAAAGIVAETVVPGPFSGVIKTGGQILPAQGDEMTVVAPADGIVSFGGNYVEGSEVDGGKPLFSIVSGGIQDGNRIGKAKVAYETAKAEYERASGLVESRIVSQKDFLRIKEEYENARMAYEALKPNADGTGVVVEAPFKGYVKSLLVSEGDYVPMGTPLASVTQNRRLVLKADLSQRYYGRLGQIVSANFMTPYDDHVQSIASLGGRLVSSGRSSADGSYYIPVTFEFDNRGSVVPGSFAEVWLLTSKRENVLSLPVSAITEEQGLYFVYLKMDASCYTKREVTLGESDGARTEIISGIKAGDNVVVKGAYNVKLASASNAIPAHTHNH